MDEKKFTHFDESGRASMVNVGSKEHTLRTAIAFGRIIMQPETLKMIDEQKHKKGDVLCVAQVAGIMGAKKTHEIIPMCHSVFLSGVKMSFELNYDISSVDITAQASCNGQTGVEMEALNAVSTAALTIYDMCKAVDKSMLIDRIHLKEKSGGRSGHYIADQNN